MERSDIWPFAIRLYHVDTHGWYDVDQTFDELHPSVEGHKAIAAKLAKWLKTNRILAKGNLGLQQDCS